ncbi:MAG: type II toxin-antitoxin system VapC family toxin [Anaerolineales bacterium]|jgi:predicted nucleic acid-binding protein|nr:type II toxin-antitoxin system VapC family toxin [Anaerolineales bacterium]MCC6986426.1 type II toxin-antitoxin system VapC family toxin [Anaerolineales bacterium]
MKNAVTVDASVLVNAFSPEEEGSEDSMAFLTRLSEERTPLIQPTLFLPEITASIARKQDDTDAALELERDLKSFLELTLIDLDEDLADFASEVAAKHRLRGSDSVYAAVALRFGTELITLDREQLERLPKVLPVRKPE